MGALKSYHRDPTGIPVAERRDRAAA